MRFVLVCVLAVLFAVGVSVADGKRKPPPPPTTTTVPDPPPPPPPSGPVVERVAVVLINFTNDTSEPWTLEQARDIAFGPAGTAAFYLEASYGKQTIAGDVFGWWQVPYANSPCDTLAWKNAARARALEQGVNLDLDYDAVSLVWPRTSACGFNSRTGTFHNGDFTPYSHAHELGHSSFNMSHADGWFCRDAAGVEVSLSLNCTPQSYGDIFSVMGAAFRPFNGWEKIRLGWLDNYQVVSQSGRYALSPLGLWAAPSPQTLLFGRADGTVFSAEFRQRGPFEPGNLTDLKFHGVMLRTHTEMPFVRSQDAHGNLIDAHPGGTLARFDAPFTPGETLADPLGGITITVVSVAPDGAVVEVTVGG